MWISVPHEDVLESDKITAYHLRLVASVIVFIILGIINRVMHAYHYVKKFGGGMSFAVRIAPIVEVPWLMSALGSASFLFFLSLSYHHKYFCLCVSDMILLPSTD